MNDNRDLRKLVKSYFRASKNVVLLAVRVSKSRALTWTAARHQTRLNIESRILSITSKQSLTKKSFEVKIRVLKQIGTRKFQTEDVYKLKHLSKVEAIAADNSGCTLVLGFDNLKAQKVRPPQWILGNLDDRNKLLTCILKSCKENVGRMPKIVGMVDVVEMTLWEQENGNQIPIDGLSSLVLESHPAGPEAEKDTLEKHLVSKAEEDDMEALLDSYAIGIDESEAFSESLKHELTALDAANVHDILESQPLVKQVLQELDAVTVGLEDMEEWLRIFNVKLLYMRQDIESIESRNNLLKVQAKNNGELAEELNRLLESLRVPSQYMFLLTSGSFEVSSMPENEEACEWLVGGLCNLEPPFLGPAYINMHAVREKHSELEKLKETFVQRASHFLRNYFASVVDSMVRDISEYSPKGPLRRPDHADLHFKFMCYARLLQYINKLDGKALGPLRKAYCSSLNLLFRREARDFVRSIQE